MLTYNDLTVENAFEIFEKAKDSKAEFWGFKETPLPVEEMKKLFGYMKECGKTTFLEVVEYTEEKCIAGAKTAIECGCDVLMGTSYFDSVSRICRENGIKYMPFAGDVSERPSVLRGSVKGIIGEAKESIGKGCDGIDLLGYRYTRDSADLNNRFVDEIDAPVCIAGSVDSYEKLDELKETRPWAFTIGSAFFDNKFGEGFSEQINRVCEYMAE